MPMKIEYLYQSHRMNSEYNSLSLTSNDYYYKIISLHVDTWPLHIIAIN